MRKYSKRKLIIFHALILLLVFTFSNLNAINPKSTKNEKAWFQTLNKITEDKLKKGDILIKKDYKGISPVVKAQKLFIAEMGSKYSAHALIYLYNGKISECSNAKKGVFIGQISEYWEYGLLVYRCTDNIPRHGAAKIARSWAADTGESKNISYSTQHCFHAWTNSSAFGDKGKERARHVARTKKWPTDEMMCSEFVTYCYQATDPPAIKLDAKHTAPIRLEDYLNKASNFKFVGRIHPVKK